MQCSALAIGTSATDRYKVSREVACTVATQRTDWLKTVHRRARTGNSLQEFGLGRGRGGLEL